MVLNSKLRKSTIIVKIFTQLISKVAEALTSLLELVELLLARREAVGELLDDFVEETFFLAHDAIAVVRLKLTAHFENLVELEPRAVLVLK